MFPAEQPHQRSSEVMWLTGSWWRWWLQGMRLCWPWRAVTAWPRSGRSHPAHRGQRFAAGLQWTWRTQNRPSVLNSQPAAPPGGSARRSNTTSRTSTGSAGAVYSEPNSGSRNNWWPDPERRKVRWKKKVYRQQSIAALKHQGVWCKETEWKRLKMNKIK